MSAIATLPPPIPRVTPDDLLRMPDRGKGWELVDGKLRAQNVSYLSSFVAGELHFILRAFVGSARLGWVAPEGTSFRCFPSDRTLVRRADTSFHRLDRLRADQAMSEGHCTVVPDLVVEVVSPNDLAEEVNAKRTEWLAAGASVVWVVYPIQQEVHVYGADGSAAVLKRTDLLTSESLLPGFQVPVAELFRLPTQ